MNPILISKTTNITSKKSPFSVCALCVGAAILLFAGASSSCATARGFGHDVEHVGDEIQEAAR